MQIGGFCRTVSDWIDRNNLHSGVLRRLQPSFVLMRRRVRWICAPNQNCPCILDRPGIEPFKRGSKYEFKRSVPRLVANSIGIYFGRAQPVEQTDWIPTSDQPDRAGVVRVKNPVSFVRVCESPEPPGDIIERFGPGHRREFAIALASGSLERTTEPQRIIPPGAIICNRALAAQNPPRDGMIGISNYPGDLSID